MLQARSDRGVGARPARTRDRADGFDALASPAVGRVLPRLVTASWMSPCLLSAEYRQCGKLLRIIVPARTMEHGIQNAIDAVQHSDGVAVLRPSLGVSSLDFGPLPHRGGFFSFRTRAIRDAPGAYRRSVVNTMVYLTFYAG